jgi:hypothetical protein
MAKNALQAVLDRATQTLEVAPPAPVAPGPAPEPKRAATPRSGAPRAAWHPTPASEKPAEAPKRFYRPSREHRQLIAGHFQKTVAKQLKMIAVEDDTTVQSLLEEALDLLFVKKGKARIADIIRRSE